MSLNLQQLDKWIQREQNGLVLDCQEAKEYCGKCKRSQCLWLMHEAYKPEKLIQYGNSKPSEDEEQAFQNWVKDTFEVVKK